MKPTEKQITDASKAHYMQYDGEYDAIAVADKAYKEAVEWAISQMQPEWVRVFELEEEIKVLKLRMVEILHVYLTIEHAKEVATETFPQQPPKD